MCSYNWPFDRMVTAARQFAKSLESQSLNDLGFSKRYVRCLQVDSFELFKVTVWEKVRFIWSFGNKLSYLEQISEVVNSMKDLMDFCRDQKDGPIGKYFSSCVPNSIQIVSNSKYKSPFFRVQNSLNLVARTIEHPSYIGHIWNKNWYFFSSANVNI